MRDAAGYVAVTPDELPAFAAYGIAPDRVTVIPNGINEKDFSGNGKTSFAQRYGVHENPFILFVGRLNPIKGPDLLLEAFASIAGQFPQQHLVFAGPDGGLLSGLQKMAAQLNIADRVHFIGYIAGQDKISAYREADFLVIPSRQEAMSIVVLEAGIIATPVLLTDRCGFNEVESVAGGRVTAATIPDLANGMRAMLQNKPALLSMGENLRQHVRKNYTWTVIVKLYLDLFSSLIAARRLPE